MSHRNLANDSRLDPIEQRIIMLARHERTIAWETPLTRRAARKRRRHSLRIMESVRIHPAAAEEIWSARQCGNTLVARRALRLFQSADRSALWRSRALYLVSELRRRKMPATSLELLQWIFLYDADSVPTVGMHCRGCIDDQDRRHALTPVSIDLWRAQRVAILAASWRLRYPHIDAVLLTAERSFDEFEMLADFESQHPQSFALILTAVGAYFNALLLPKDLQQYSIAAGELLVVAAHRALRCAAQAGDFRSPGSLLTELLMHWTAELFDQLDFADIKHLVMLWLALTGANTDTPPQEFTTIMSQTNRLFADDENGTGSENANNSTLVRREYEPEYGMPHRDEYDRESETLTYKYRLSNDGTSRLRFTGDSLERDHTVRRRRDRRAVRSSKGYYC